MNKNKFIIGLGLIALSAFLYITNSRHDIDITSKEAQHQITSKSDTTSKNSTIDESFTQDNEQKPENLIKPNFIDLNSNEFAEKEFEVKIKNSPYYPDTPIDAYIKHIENAEAGDINSQYIIHSVLKDCKLGSDIGIKSVNMEFNQQRSNRLTQLIEFYTDHCKALFNESEANIKQTEFWEKKLVENGHPFIYAEYHVLLKEFDNMKQRTGINLTEGAVIEEISINDIFAALNNGHSGKFNLMANYLRAYTPYTHLNTEVQAWYLAECIKYGMCITSNLLNEYRQHIANKSFSTSQIELIFSEAYRYLDLVENEKWDELSNLFIIK